MRSPDLALSLFFGGGAGLCIGTPPVPGPTAVTPPSPLQLIHVWFPVRVSGLWGGLWGAVSQEGSEG